MELYFAPLACSLATRMALYEVGAPARDARYVQVDTHTKRLAEGGDFYAINPMGQVPVLRTDDGALLTENTAVLQWVAERFPEARLAPEGLLGRARLREALGFVNSELHKAIFVPLLDPTATDEVKDWVRTKIALRMGVLEKRLAGREWLLDAFSVADAYLATVLVWPAATGVDLAPWPNVVGYHARVLARPAVARAFAEERDLFVASLKATSR